MRARFGSWLEKPSTYGAQNPTGIMIVTMLGIVAVTLMMVFYCTRRPRDVADVRFCRRMFSRVSLRLPVGNRPFGTVEPVWAIVAF
jgi:hypothetical protein